MSIGMALGGFIEGMRNHPEIVVGDHAKELHNRSLVVDLHNDILMYCASFKFNLNKRHGAPRYFNPLRPLTDIPRLKEGGISALGCGIAKIPILSRRGSKIGWLNGFMNTMDRVILDSKGSLTLVRSAGDFISAKKEDRIALFPGLEGLHLIEGKIEVLDALQKRGLCYVTLAHFESNEAAISNFDKKPKFTGLSGFGKEVLEKMRRLCLVIDLAHTATPTFMETVDYVKEPVMVSHTNCHGLFPLWRNVKDSEIKAVSERDGIIGIMVSPRFTAKNYCAPLSLVVDHIMHVVELVGARHASIGSDLDGLVPTPNGLRDVADFPKLTQLLLYRGLSESEIEGILGGNFLRILRRVKGE
ncbi:MAG: membrane dipeptidase [Thermoplasmata archaeon]|nr:MAG: membrane dipeptidase [Thermoplasmata archaeon]